MSMKMYLMESKVSCSASVSCSISSYGMDHYESTLIDSSTCISDVR